MNTTAEQIAKLRELEAKATKGPWVTGSIPWKVWANGGANTVCEVAACGDAVPIPEAPGLATSNSMAANRDLIAFLRNNAIPLCDALEAAQKENAELRKLVGELEGALEEQMTDVRFAISSVHVEEDSEQSLIYCADQRARAALARVSELKGGAL